MSTATKGTDTLDDLLKFEGKAELINGRIVPIMPSGRIPNLVAGRVFRSLLNYADQTGTGEAYTDNMGYAVTPPLLSGRQSFSPDVSFDFGPFPADGMSFNDRPPVFAVEVRSKNDYGLAKDRDYADKRRDYFFAGTQVVWDVDPVAETVTVYKSDDPLTPLILRRGQVADAEPAVPGWRVAVADIFA
jgi:Uma2 family endonuclease